MFGRKLSSRAQNFGKKVNKTANKFARKVSNTVDKVDSTIERGLNEAQDFSGKVARTSDKINRRIQKSGGLISDIALSGGTVLGSAIGQPELGVLASGGINSALRASDKANRRIKKGSMKFDGEVDNIRMKHNLERK